MARTGWMNEVLTKYESYDPNVKNANGLTPLGVAINAGNFDTVKQLLSKGKGVLVTDDERALAKKTGNGEIITLLAKHKN